MNDDTDLGETPTRTGITGKQWSVIGLIVALVVGSLLYRLLVSGSLEQTSMLFIGLPAILAIIVALMREAKTSTGIIFKTITIFLLMSGVLLGEGFICIVLAAPLFYLVGWAVGLLADRISDDDVKDDRHPRAPLLLFPVILLFSLEGVDERLSFSRDEIVTAEQTISATPAEVEMALSSQPRFEQGLPTFFSIGFPRPRMASGDGLEPGDRRVVDFAGGEGAPGRLVLEVAERGSGFVAFRVLSDSSHIAHWLHWKRSVVRWKQIAAGRTVVSWTLEYDRLLDPAWYFAPIERYGVGRAADYLIETLATPHGR